MRKKRRDVVTLKELEGWLSTGQAAEAMGVTRPTAIARAESGRVRAAKTATGWLYDPKSVEAFRQRGGTGAR